MRRHASEPGTWRPPARTEARRRRPVPDPKGVGLAQVSVEVQAFLRIPPESAEARRRCAWGPLKPQTTLFLSNCLMSNTCTHQQTQPAPARVIAGSKVLKSRKEKR